MRIAFMGTPNFAKNIMQTLVESKKYDVVVAYTKEDAIRGRGKNLVESPVKEYAKSVGIRVETPAKLDSEAVEVLKNLKPDFICVAAYGLILPKKVLDIPCACLNVHGSLLPKWRGAAPVQRAILAGDVKVGTSIMKMDEGMDTGDYSLQSEIEVGNKTLSEIFEELSHLGANDLMEVLDNFEDISWTKQDESQVTIASKLNKRDLWLKNNDSPQTTIRKIKASSPECPAKCIIGNRCVTILDAELNHNEQNPPMMSNSSLGWINVLRIKADGKREMSWDEFVAGVQDKSPQNLRIREIV